MYIYIRRTIGTSTGNRRRALNGGRGHKKRADTVWFSEMLVACSAMKCENIASAERVCVCVCHIIHYIVSVVWQAMRSTLLYPRSTKHYAIIITYRKMLHSDDDGRMLLVIATSQIRREIQNYPTDDTIFTMISQSIFITFFADAISHRMGCNTIFFFIFKEFCPLYTWFCPYISEN